MASHADRVRQMGDRIRSWLRDMGWKVEDAPDPAWAWGVNVAHAPGSVVSVYQQSKDPDVIMIRALVVANQQQHERIRENQRERESFLQEAASRLLYMNLFSEMIEGTPTFTLAIGQRIFYDGLTKDAFFQRYSLVGHGGIMILAMMALKFGGAPPATPSLH